MSKNPWVKWYSADFLNGIADMDPNQIAVYSVVLNRIYDNEGPIDDDVERIARRCNMRPTSCKKAVDTLVESGKLIRRDGVLSNSRCEKEIKSRQKLAQKSSESARSRWGNRDENPNENNDDVMQPHMPNECEGDAYQKPEARTRKPPNPLEGEFEEFYREYPKRVDRKKAERAYRATRKTVPHAKLMAGVRAYRDEVKGKDPQFIKHPTTWLNAGSWENTPTAEPTSQNYSDDMWETFLVGYAEGKTWPKSTRGPAPNEAGCQAPERLLSRYLNRFGNLEPGHLAQKGQAA